MVDSGLVGDQSGRASSGAVAHEPERFARNPQTNLYFRTDWNELDELAQRVGQEIAALVPTIEPDPGAQQARRDSDPDRLFAR
jgi:hypothetical protein